MDDTPIGWFASNDNVNDNDNEYDEVGDNEDNYWKLFISVATTIGDYYLTHTH